MRSWIAGALVIIAFVTAGRTYGQERHRGVRVVKPVAEVLSAPSSGNVLKFAPQGTLLEVLGEYKGWYWVLLGWDGNTARHGWIRAQDVELVTLPAEPPAGEPAQQAPSAPRPAPSPTPGDADEAAQKRLEKARQELDERRREYQAALQRAHRSTIGIRAFGAIDSNTVLARQSFDAVLGTSRLMAFGGGADVLNVWKSVFVRAAVSHTSGSGSRAFVADGQVVPLNIPIRISMTPVDVGAGWRFVSSRSPRVVPYAGGGALVQFYSEKSDFAGPGDDVSQRNFGFMAFGGVEVAISKWVVAGGEAQYRAVPNAIGAGGVSQEFGETNLGGFALRVLVGVKR